MFRRFNVMPSALNVLSHWAEVLRDPMCRSGCGVHF